MKTKCILFSLKPELLNKLTLNILISEETLQVVSK